MGAAKKIDPFTPIGAVHVCGSKGSSTMTEEQKELVQLQKRLAAIKLAVQEKYGTKFVPPEFRKLTTSRIVKTILALTVPPACYVFARITSYYESEKLAGFRDKSALFGRKLKPGEEPSW